MTDDAAAQLARQLHELDAELNRLRVRIFRVEHGLEVVDDREAELDRLRREYAAIGDRFIATYRLWSKSHAED